MSVVVFSYDEEIKKKTQRFLRLWASGFVNMLAKEANQVYNKTISL